MRAAVLKAPNELVLTEAPEARAEPGDLVLRVKAATICGTGIRILRGGKTVGVRYPSARVSASGRAVHGRGPDLRGLGYTDKPPVFEG